MCAVATATATATAGAGAATHRAPSGLGRGTAG